MLLVPGLGLDMEDMAAVVETAVFFTLHMNAMQMPRRTAIGASARLARARADHRTALRQRALLPGAPYIRRAVHQRLLVLTGGVVMLCAAVVRHAASPRAT